MARLNMPRNRATQYTHEGAPAKRIDAQAQLRRSVMSSMLWEDSFYEDGQSIADRIKLYAENVSPEILAKIAIEARTVQHLRHVPLLLTAVLCRTGRGTSLVSDTIEQVIQRADELTEFCAVYAEVNGTTPDKLKLSAQAKKGLAKAFRKFDEYQLAKYNRDGAVRLRDVLFLAHPTPRDKEQEALWKRLIDGTIKTPDTWEVALSGGGDKRQVFEKMLLEGTLGYMALLRNLRNMLDAQVPCELIVKRLTERTGASRVLPFRFVAAAKAAPQLEAAIDQAMQYSIDALPKLKRKTVILVDVSGSMDDRLSGKSDMSRMDAAAVLGSMVNGDAVRVFTFSQRLVEVPPRRGMAGVDVIKRSQPHRGTDLGSAVDKINRTITYDRLIVITDEQTSTHVSDPNQDAAGYIINVAAYQNGVGYGRWVHIDGFSENVLKFIYELENAR